MYFEKFLFFSNEARGRLQSSLPSAKWVIPICNILCHTLEVHLYLIFMYQKNATMGWRCKLKNLKNVHQKVMYTKRFGRHKPVIPVKTFFTILVWPKKILVLNFLLSINNTAETLSLLYHTSLAKKANFWLLSYFQQHSSKTLFTFLLLTTQQINIVYFARYSVLISLLPTSKTPWCNG